MKCSSDYLAAAGSRLVTTNLHTALLCSRLDWTDTALSFNKYPCSDLPSEEPGQMCVGAVLKAQAGVATDQQDSLEVASGTDKVFWSYLGGPPSKI